MNFKINRHATALAVAAATFFQPVQAHGARFFGPWEDTQPVFAINTAASAEGCPIEAPNGRSLYIASNRPGGSGKLDVWRSFRSNVHSIWGLPENLGPIVNSAEFDYCPTPLHDGWLMFVTSNPTADDCFPGDLPPAPPVGGPAAGDMYLTRERRRHGWHEPMHLGCYPDGPNTAGAEFSPSLVYTSGGLARGTLLYFSSNGYPDSELQDIYVSQMLWDGTVLPGTRVAELSTEFDDRMPNVRQDGLEIVFSSNRPGGAGQQDVYVSTRSSIFVPWSPPRRIDDPAINTPASETRASLSGDGTRLHFGRKVNADDPGDIYVSTRRRWNRRGY